MGYMDKQNTGNMRKIGLFPITGRPVDEKYKTRRERENP
jgi:hypothetical protein